MHYRSFDMGATGKIPESRFKLLLKTKDVPKEDVEEMLEGDEKFDSSNKITTMVVVEA